MTKHWEHCEKSHTKIAKRVLGALNKDIVSVVFDEKVFWFEPVVSYIKIPKDSLLMKMCSTQAHHTVLVNKLASNLYLLIFY